MAAPSGRLAGRLALITGASRGIGRAVALRFAEEGADLVLVARTEAGLAEVDDEIRRLGRHASLVPADLTDLDVIDQIGAAMLLVEIGTDMAVFGSAERLASWVGICPGNHESAGKRKSGKTRKGNAWVRRLLCEFAQAAARSRCALKDKFTALTLRKGHKKSIVALAHKLLRINYAMLSRHTPYQDRAVDYAALLVQHNAPRWIKMLVKHGFITPVTA